LSRNQTKIVIRKKPEKNHAFLQKILSKEFSVEKENRKIENK